MFQHFHKAVKFLFTLGDRNRTRLEREKVEYDEEESATLLLIREFAYSITTVDQRTLHHLIINSAKRKALKAQIFRKLSEPRKDYFLAQVLKNSHFDADGPTKQRKRDTLWECFSKAVAAFRKIFAWIAILPAVGLLALRLLLSILDGLTTRFITICRSALGDKNKVNVEEFASNIEAWLAFHDFPEMREANLLTVRSKLLGMSHDANAGNMDRRIAMFLLKQPTYRNY